MARPIRYTLTEENMSVLKEIVKNLLVKKKTKNFGFQKRESQREMAIFC